MKDLVEICYEDDYLIAVNKPVGIPTHATLDPNRMHLVECIKSMLQKRDPATPVYLGIHHRLDLETSGVILFSKQKSVNPALAELFAGRKLQKEYFCISVSDASVKFPFNVKNYLAKKPGKGKGMRPVRAGGDYAETDFVLVSESKVENLHQRWGKRAYCIRAYPKTGRMHQIRVHLAESDLPIMGDELYGGAAQGRVMLHAASLTLDHPVTNVSLKIEASLPSDFSQCLKRFHLSSPR